MLKRLSSSSVISTKPTPSKVHHHFPLPDSSFPKGYLLTGLHCGIKKTSAPDLAVLLSTSNRPASAAGCFTRNVFKAAPVWVSQEVLRTSGGKARGVVVNSGCANAVTGQKGLDDAWAMAKETDILARSMSSNKNLKRTEGQCETLVMSTGVIGNTIPISNVISGIRSLAGPPDSQSKFGAGFDAWERAAKAFMTTDTFPKLRSRTFTINGVEYRMAGIDKGAGMIHPHMIPPSSPSPSAAKLHATLLGCILTDAAVSPRSLQTALTYAVQRSFNSISVDGEMSTNDTVLALANGAGAQNQSSAEEIDEDRDVRAYELFRDHLTAFAVDLAKLVVRDGEGATKFVTVVVEGAPTYADAHRIASRISTSALVKTALFGEDANWGRILSAAGSVPLSPSSSGSPAVEINPSRVSVSFVPSDGSPPLRVLVNGEPELVDEVRAKEILAAEEFGVQVDMGMGNERAKYWTCDFSYEYVRINGDYRT